MEIKAHINKPFTDEAKDEFIMYYGQNCMQENTETYEIRETDEQLQAWGYTEEEKAEQKRERLNNLTLTRGDVFAGLIQARMIDEATLKAQLEEMPETTDEEKVRKMLAINSLSNALNFHRGHDLVAIIGEQLGITTENIDLFFETNDYHYLQEVPVESTSSNYDFYKDVDVYSTYKNGTAYKAVK